MNSLFVLCSKNYFYFFEREKSTLFGRGEGISKTLENINSLQSVSTLLPLIEGTLIYTFSKTKLPYFSLYAKYSMRATFSYIVVSEFCTSLYVLATVTMTLNTYSVYG